MWTSIPGSASSDFALSGHPKKCKIWIPSSFNHGKPLQLGLVRCKYRSCGTTVVCPVLDREIKLGHMLLAVFLSIFRRGDPCSLGSKLPDHSMPHCHLAVHNCSAFPTSLGLTTVQAAGAAIQVVLHWRSRATVLSAAQ